MTPDALRQAIERTVVDTLRAIHHDGTGCGTSGTGGCSVCFGPSPLDATEIAEHLVPALMDAVAPALEAAQAENQRLRAQITRQHQWACEVDSLRAAVECWEQAEEIIARVRALCDRAPKHRDAWVYVEYIRAALDGEPTDAP